MKYSLVAVLPALAAASPTFHVGTIHNDAAPVLSSTHAVEIPNSYMVVFKKHVKDTKKHHDWVQSIHTKNSQERLELRKRSKLPSASELFNGLKHTYEIAGGLTGYSGHFDDETLEEIRRHPDVSLFRFHPISIFPRTACLGLRTRQPVWRPIDSSAPLCRQSREHVVTCLCT